MNWATISAVALRPARDYQRWGGAFAERDAVHRTGERPEPVQIRVLERRERRAQRQLHGHEVDEQAVGAQLGTAELRVNQGGDSRAEERRVAQLERERVGTAVLHCYGVHGAPGPAPAGGRAA